MKKLLGFTMLLVLASVISANAVFFHPMITFENTAQNFTPKAFVANGHFAFYLFEKGTGATETHKALYIPIEVGYAFDERWSASFILPLVDDMPVSPAESKFGLADPWIKGKFIPMLGPNLSIGPRIAFRLPVGTSGIATKHMAIDFTGLVHMGYKTAFKLDGQIGMTLEFNKREDYVESKFSSPLYFIAEPGYAFNPKMSFNGIIGFSIPVIKSQLQTGGVTTKGEGDEKMMWVGEKFHWAFSPSVTMNEIFSYKVWSKIGHAVGDDTDGSKDLYFGAGVTANIPI